MKISKSLLSKIIKEEIKKALYESHASWEIPLAQYFIYIRDMVDQGKGDINKQKFIKHIEDITDQKYIDAIKYMDGKVDYNLYGTVAALMINQKPNVPAMLPNSYKTTDPTYRDMSDVRSPYSTKAAPTHNRRPQPISQEDQEDPRINPETRSEKKNWVHEVKNNVRTSS